MGADAIRVFTDVKNKPSAHAIAADVNIVDTAKAAEVFTVDGVIVSGSATGQPAEPSEVEAVADAVTVPTLVGSGITAENISLFSKADALIVGSSVKQNGLWSNPIDVERARELRQAFEG